MSLNGLLKTFDEEKQLKIKAGSPPKAYIEEKGVDLKGIIQRMHLRMIRDKNAISQGKGFSPSMITYGFCHRLKVAQMLGLVQTYYDKPTPALQLKFDMGNAVHDIWQNRFWDLGILRGDYKCYKCDKIYADIVSPTACPSGIKSHKRSSLKYKEVPLRNEEFLLSGRADGILTLEGGDEFVDVKSISNRTLKTPLQQFVYEDLELQGPPHKHIVQLCLYMLMHPSIKTGHLLYAAKNADQYKTYPVAFDRTIIEPYLETAALLKAHMESRTLPGPCGSEKCICHTVTIPRSTQTELLSGVDGS